MRKVKLLHKGRSKANTRFKHPSSSYRKLTQPGSNTLLETVRLHWLLLPELEVDIFLACRDALRCFFLAFILFCLVSTIADYPQN